MQSFANVLSVVSLCIALLSFGLSLFNSFRLRKALDFRVSKKAERICGIVATYHDSECNIAYPDPFKEKFTHIISATFINPSGASISYFDLEVTNKARTISYQYPIHRWIDMFNIKSLSYLPSGSSDAYGLSLPSSDKGNILSNSCCEIMLAINCPEEKEVCISFKIPKRSLFKSRRHSSPDRYKTISKRIFLP